MFANGNFFSLDSFMIDFEILMKDLVIIGMKDKDIYVSLCFFIILDKILVAKGIRYYM